MRFGRREILLIQSKIGVSFYPRNLVCFEYKHTLLDLILLKLVLRDTLEVIN